MGGLHAGALGLLVELDDVEPDGLAQRAALATGDLIACTGIECWGAVSRDHLVPLLVTTVLGDKVEVIPGRNECERPTRWFTHASDHRLGGP